MTLKAASVQTVWRSGSALPLNPSWCHSSWILTPRSVAAAPSVMARRFSIWLPEPAHSLLRRPAPPRRLIGSADRHQLHRDAFRKRSRRPLASHAFKHCGSRRQTVRVSAVRSRVPRGATQLRRFGWAGSPPYRGPPPRRRAMSCPSSLSAPDGARVSSDSERMPSFEARDVGRFAAGSPAARFIASARRA